MRCCPDRQVDFGDIFATLSWQQNVEMVSKKAKRVFQEVDNLSQAKDWHTQEQPGHGQGQVPPCPSPGQDMLSNSLIPQESMEFRAHCIPEVLQSQDNHTCREAAEQNSMVLTDRRAQGLSTAAGLQE